MSLDYIDEKPQPEEVAPETENYQRATVIFPLYSVILIACLVAVYLGQLYADSLPAVIEVISNSAFLAGFVKPFFNEGQYWRILTAAALHGGILHLAFNSYALFVLGKLIETLSNRAHLAMIFVLAAIGGGILSLIFLPDVTSIGASGGVIGFLGYLTVYGFKRRKLLPDAFLKNMLFNVVFIAFVGIFVMSNIDNYGHLGGFLVGAIYGLIQIPSDLYKDPRETNQTTKVFGLIALGIFILTAVFSILILLGIIQIPIPSIFLS